MKYLKNKKEFEFEFEYLFSNILDSGIKYYGASDSSRYIDLGIFNKKFITLTDIRDNTKLVNSFDCIALDFMSVKPFHFTKSMIDEIKNINEYLLTQGLEFYLIRNTKYNFYFLDLEQPELFKYDLNQFQIVYKYI